MQIESERRAIVKVQREKAKQADNDIWEVHHNGVMYERQRKKLESRKNTQNA